MYVTVTEQCFSQTINLGFAKSDLLIFNYLLLTVDDLALSLDNRAQSDCILLDFSKAFNKVSHKLLLKKLKFYGITAWRDN